MHGGWRTQLASFRKVLGTATQTEAGRVQAALTAKTERLEETERMCALLRDQAHKQLGGTDAAEVGTGRRPPAASRH